MDYHATTKEISKNVNGFEKATMKKNNYIGTIIPPL
jgi:peptidyl-dipeptidase Dcp